MEWKWMLGILLIIQNCGIILTKLSADRIPKKSMGLFYQYLFCAFLATLYATLAGKINISSVLIGVGAVGVLNVIGSYFWWQTSTLSLSKTALFYPLMEAITIVLAVIFLKEGALWNIQLIAGVVICFLTMLYFGFPKEKHQQDSENSKWLLNAAGMILAFGVAGFFLKFFSDKVPRETFLMGFYVGAFLGSIPLLALERQNPIQVPKNAILWVLPTGLAIFGASGALYWTYQLGGPVSFVNPVRGLLITIIPVLVGLFFFREKNKLHSIHDWLVFIIGIVAVVLILIR